MNILAIKTGRCTAKKRGRNSAASPGIGEYYLFYSSDPYSYRAFFSLLNLKLYGLAGFKIRMRNL